MNHDCPDWAGRSLTITALSAWNRTIAEEILARFRQYAVEFSGSSTSTKRLSGLGQEARVVSVWGPKGTGKSSIVGAVQECLLNEADHPFVVVGPIQPEFFGPADNLLSVVLAELRRELIRTLAEEESPSVSSDEARRIIAAIEGAELTVAVSQATLPLLANAAATVDEFGRQIQRVAGATGGLWRRLAEATTQVAEAYGWIAILVDDPDLAPYQTLSTFRDIRNLATLPGVALLVAGNREMTRPALAPSSDLEIDGSGGAPDSRRWPSVGAELLAAETKVFPLSGSFSTSPPPWEERKAFVKLGRSESIEELLRQCAPYTPSDRNLLLNSLTAHSPLSAGYPLPERFRSLAQLWDQLDNMRQRPPTDLATSVDPSLTMSYLCNALFAHICPPRGARPIALSWGPVIETPSGRRRRVSCKFLSLNSGVTADSGFRDQVVLESSDNDNAVHLRLRSAQQVGSACFWAREEDFPRAAFKSDAAEDDMAAVLAIQEILYDSKLFDVGDEEALAGGFRPPSMAFLQVVRFEGQETDDHLVTLPTVKTWSGIAPAAQAWNGIVERWRDQGLSCVEVLALTLGAAHALANRDGFEAATASLDYRGALGILESYITTLEGSDDQLTLGQQELVNWYIGSVPAHWHSSIFGEEDIDLFTTNWNRVAKNWTSNASSSRRYRKWTLGQRLSSSLEDARDAGRALKLAWLGGYEQVVDRLAIKVPALPFSRVCRAWRDRVRMRHLGTVATRDAAAPPEENTGPESDAVPMTQPSEGADLLSSAPAPAADSEEARDGLMQAALLAIDQWQASADDF